MDRFVVVEERCSKHDVPLHLHQGLFSEHLMCPMCFVEALGSITNWDEWGTLNGDTGTARKSCHNCDTTIESMWDFCPNCGEEQ